MNGHRMGWRALALAASVLLTWALPAWADPPGRVIRLGYATGEVSFLPAGADDWVDARVNRPLWAGDRLWTDNGARAELQTSNAALRVAPGTSISIVAFDDRIAQYEVNEGTVRLRVRSLAPDETVEIDTPNLAFAIRSPGDYRVDVDPDATTVAVYRGAAEAFGTQAAYAINAGMRIRFGGTELSDYAMVPIARADPFDGWVRDRVRYEERSVSARYVAPSVVGYEDLDRYGSWRVVADYGNVWTPNNIAPDWAPYRYGHWAWIDPWGWTWVDDAPWGFAPFHYGRWAFVDSRWCWVPGPRREQAVYAPALVGFVGGGGLSVSVSAGGGGIGWFPLAPGEIYRPPYQASREYFTRVNVTNTTVNVTQVTNVYNSPQTDVRYVNFARSNAVTAVPTQTFVQAQPVQRAMQKVDAQALQRVTVVGAPQVAPARASIAGSTAPARAQPAANIVERPVIAKTPPPPAPPSIEQREQALKREPGKPLDQAELHKLAPAAAARPNVRVAQPAAPAKALPPAASTGTEKGQPQQSARGKEAPPAKVEPPQVGTAPAAGSEKGPTSAQPAPTPSAAAPPPPQARGRGTPSPVEATTNGVPAERPLPPGRANVPVAKGQERPQPGAAPVERPAPGQAAPAPVTRPESSAEALQKAEPRGRPQAANVPPPRAAPQPPREAPQAAAPQGRPETATAPRETGPRGTPEAAAAPQPPREAPQAAARGRPETATAPHETGPRGRPETVAAPPRTAPSPQPEQGRAPETRPQPNAARRAPEPGPQRATPEPAPQQAAVQPSRPPEARPQPQPRAAEPQRPAPGKGKEDKDKDKDKEKGGNDK